MKKKILTLITSTFLLTTSCSDFLNTTPTDFLNPENYFTNAGELDAALRAAYKTLANNSLYGNAMLMELALTADEGFNSNASPVIGNVRYYSVSDTDADILRYWQQLYYGIDKVNIILENIDRPVMDDVKRGYAKSEALFLRAYFHLLLVRRFGDVPLRTVSAKSVNDGYDARTPKREVYNQIWTDLIEAEKIAQPIDQIGNGGRISKSAIQGMLARTALYMAGHPLCDETMWKQAAFWSDQVIKSGKHSLNIDYEQIFKNFAQDLYDYKEVIFEVEFWGNNEPPYANSGKVGLINSGPLYNAASSPTFGVSYGFINATDWLYKSYRIVNLYDSKGNPIRLPNGKYATKTDIRRDRNIANFTFAPDGTEYPRGTISGFGRSTRKWDRRDESASSRVFSTGSPQNFPIIRYADILLMYAESCNEILNTADQFASENEILNAINQVRRRGFGFDINTPAKEVDIEPGTLTKEQLRDEIRLERARELCYESLRKDDVIRWGIFEERMHETYLEMKASDWGGNARQAYFSNATARDTLWPIPSYERGLNPNLTQNQPW